MQQRSSPYSNTYIHSHIHAFTHTHIYTHTKSHFHIYTYPHMYTLSHTYTYSQIHTHTTHTYTYSHIFMSSHYDQYRLLFLVLQIFAFILCVFLYKHSKNKTTFYLLAVTIECPFKKITILMLITWYNC